jgi:dolichyl-phosphate-mannose-protein mannosyltransferase
MALGLSVIAALFVLLTVPFLNRPVDSWEWLHRSAAQSIVLSGVPALSVAPGAGAGPRSLVLVHPPSSAYLTALSLWLLGDGEWQARLPGVVVVLLTGIGLALLVRRRLGADPAAAWVATVAAAVYLLHAATVHGALYLGFSDGTLLPLTWVLFVAAWLETGRWGMSLRVLAIGACMALALWAKLTTSLALPATLAVVAAITHGARAAVGLSLGVAAVGCGLFLATWWVYVLHLAPRVDAAPASLWGEPFRYLLDEGSVFSLDGLLLSSARLVLYFGPLFVAAAVGAVVRRLRETFQERREKPEALVPALVIVVTVAYLVLPGGVGAFPKYHLVILPFVAWLVATELGRGADHHRPRLIVLAGAGAVYFAFLVGDPVKVLNYDLRMGRLEGGAGGAVARLTIALLLSVAFVGLARVLCGGWRAAFLAAIVASQLGLVAVQAQGGYFTTHLYGTPVSEFTRAIDLVRSDTPLGSAIVALPEVGYAAGRPLVPGIARRFWHEPAELTRLIRRTAPSAVVWGAATHTLAQVRTLEQDPALAETLARDYRRHAIGGFTVWLRGR